MKQIPKYEYFLLQAERHNFYVAELTQELNSQITMMAVQGWQLEGPHQLMIKGTNSDYLILTQMMKRFHPEYMKIAETEHSLMFDKEAVANLPIVVE